MEPSSILTSSSFTSTTLIPCFALKLKNTEDEKTLRPWLGSQYSTLESSISLTAKGLIQSVCPRKTIKDLRNLLTLVDCGKSNKWRSIWILEATVVTIIHIYEGLRATPKKTGRVQENMAFSFNHHSPGIQNKMLRLLKHLCYNAWIMISMISPVPERWLPTPEQPRLTISCIP